MVTSQVWGSCYSKGSVLMLSASQSHTFRGKAAQEETHGTSRASFNALMIRAWAAHQKREKWRIEYVTWLRNIALLFITFFFFLKRSVISAIALTGLVSVIQNFLGWAWRSNAVGYVPDIVFWWKTSPAKAQTS